VFPRVPVGIRTTDAVPTLADAGRIMFYNDGQAYTRELLHQRGDECEWFSVDSDSLRDMLRDCEHGMRCDSVGTPAGGHEGAEGTAFPFTCGPSTPALYVRQRSLFNQVAMGNDPDPLRIEVGAMRVVAEAVALSVRSAASGRRRGASRTIGAATRRAHAEAADAARALICRRFRERLSLACIAREVHVSGFHLARVFRAHTGFSLHRYILMLRLAAALERLEDPRCRLSDLAHELGFSSHAHFAAVFARAFGCPPSTVRAGKAARDDRRTMSTILKAG